MCCSLCALFVQLLFSFPNFQMTRFGSLPDEVVRRIIGVHGAKELLAASKKYYKVSSKHPRSLIVHSPKSTNIGEAADDERVLTSYLMFLQNCTLSPTHFLYSVVDLHLNLAHFNKDTRLPICVQFSNCVSKMPMLNAVTLTLDSIIETDNTHLLIGQSDTVTELTINIHRTTHLKASMLAASICDNYTRLKVLRIHRPSFVQMPGFDLSTQEHFIATFNAFDGGTMRKPNTILFKNYEVVDGIITTDTTHNYIHTYNRRHNKFAETTAKARKRYALTKYYKNKRTEVDEVRLLKCNKIDILALEFDALEEDVQKCCKLIPFVRDTVRVLLQDNQAEKALYRAYSVRKQLETLYPGLIDECMNTYVLLTSEMRLA